MPVTKTSWVAGQSGNPAGRPKGRRPLSEAIRGLLDEAVDVTPAGEPIDRSDRLAAALMALAERAEDPAIQLRAMALVLERVEGRPTAGIGLSMETFNAALSKVNEAFAHAIEMHAPDRAGVIFAEIQRKVSEALAELDGEE